MSSLKRVLAENLICDRATPPFDRATMDGIAVCWDKDIKNKKFTLLGELQAGEDFSFKFRKEKIQKGQAVQIMTGASALPKGCNQVIPVENLVFVENSINKEVFFKEEPKNQFLPKKEKTLFKKNYLKNSV